MKKGTLSLLALLMLTSMLAYISCRKLDTVSIEKPQTDLVERFLNLPSSASPEAKRIAERLKELNKRANFLNEIAKHDGFPVWDKAVFSKPQNNRRQTTSRSNSSNDTIAYIPLVQPNGNQVTAFIYARLNDSINLQLHRADNYADYGFGTLQDTAKNAEKLALQFMLLDNNVFGHTDFKVLDNRLFQDNYLPIGTLVREKKVSITRPNSSPQARWEFYDYDVCTSELYWECSALGSCCKTAGVAEGACDKCAQYKCWKTRPTCTKTTIVVYIDDGPPQGGGGGPTGDGGGGTGGGGSTGSTQCNPTPELDNGLPPCPRRGGDGWMPEVEPIDPCDQYIIDLQNDSNFAANFKSLNQSSVLNLNYEKGFYVADKNANNYIAVQGNPNEAAISFSSLRLPLNGFLHSHYNGLNSIFSPGDVYFMAQLFLRGLAKDSNNLFFGVTSNYGDPYLIKVTNTADFRKFAEKITKDERSIEKFLEDYAYKFNSDNATKNEKGFLDMMNDMRVGKGFTLFRGNSDCTQWTKLTRNNFGGDPTETNCN